MSNAIAEKRLPPTDNLESSNICRGEVYEEGLGQIVMMKFLIKHGQGERTGL